MSCRFDRFYGSEREALRLQPPRRHVIRNGVEIARTTATQELRGL
ncbi:MAG TPA: hypothetical protein VIQ50_13435 [Xanthobacteraceae bacterium]